MALVLDLSIGLAVDGDSTRAGASVGDGVGVDVKLYRRDIYVRAAMLEMLKRHFPLWTAINSIGMNHLQKTS